MEGHPVAASKRGRGRQEIEANRQERAPGECTGRRQDPAAGELRQLRTREVRAHPLPGAGFRGLAAVHLDAAHADAPALRQELQLLILRDRAGNEAPGDDRAESRDRERAIDRKTNPARRPIGIGPASRQAEDRALQVLDPRPGPGRHRHDLRVFQRGTPRHLPDVRSRDVDELRSDAVRLGHRDDAPTDAEHPHDLEVLAGLGHDRLVGRHDEENRVDAARAREHVADEALVARNVDEGHAHSIPLRVREAQVDRDAPPLLLGKAIGVDPRESLHERGLAVIDVPGGADEEAVHGPKATAVVASRACATASRAT